MKQKKEKNRKKTGGKARVKGNEGGQRKWREREQDRRLHSYALCLRAHTNIHRILDGRRERNPVAGKSYYHHVLCDFFYGGTYRVTVYDDTSFYFTGCKTQPQMTTYVLQTIKPTTRRQIFNNPLKTRPIMSTRSFFFRLLNNNNPVDGWYLADRYTIESFNKFIRLGIKPDLKFNSFILYFIIACFALCVKLNMFS